MKTQAQATHEQAAWTADERTTAQHIQINGQIVEQLKQPAEQSEGHAVRVTIIQGGRSKNGFVYDDQALHSVAQLIEGAQAYADHARRENEQATRSVRDVWASITMLTLYQPWRQHPHASMRRCTSSQPQSGSGRLSKRRAIWDVRS
jgi:hypothetical protein